MPSLFTSTRINEVHLFLIVFEFSRSVSHLIIPDLLDIADLERHRFDF